MSVQYLLGSCSRDIVKKRLERTQSRLDKIPQQELLLEAAHALRVERDRQKELQSQLEDQRQCVQKASTVNYCFYQQFDYLKIVLKLCNGCKALYNRIVLVFETFNKFFLL